jgi:hypothetical protein
LRASMPPPPPPRPFSCVLYALSAVPAIRRTLQILSILSKILLPLRPSAPPRLCVPPSSPSAAPSVDKCSLILYNPVKRADTRDPFRRKKVRPSNSSFHPFSDPKGRFLDSGAAAGAAKTPFANPRIGPFSKTQNLLLSPSPQGTCALVPPSQKARKGPISRPSPFLLQIAVSQSPAAVPALPLAPFAASRENKHPRKTPACCASHGGFATPLSMCYPCRCRGRQLVRGASSDKINRIPRIPAILLSCLRTIRNRTYDLEDTAR